MSERQAARRVVRPAAGHGGEELDEQQNRRFGQNRKMVDLARLVEDFALCVERADLRHPQAVSSRTGRTYQPGIGPHTEAAAIALVLAELVALDPIYSAHRTNVPYPDQSRQRCDWCLGSSPTWD
jgi:hypothetical protein